MKHKGNFEVILLLFVVSCSSFCYRYPAPTSQPPNSIASPYHTPQPESVSISTILRWSSRGGCYAESDIYFELRTDKIGASWIALLCAYGGWHENLLGQESEPRHQRGNYLACGRLSVKQTNQLIAALAATEPLLVGSQQLHTGPVTSLYVKLGDEENKVANFQANWEAKEAPEFRFTSFAFSGLFEQVHHSLTARFESGQQPDYPLKAPGLHWLTNETESLFHQYSERLPNWE